MRLRTIFGLLTLGGCLAGQTLSSEEQSAVLAGVREYALGYAHRLPNYTATQVTQRRMRPIPQGRFTAGSRSQTDVVEEQVSYVDGQDLHKVLTVNGRAATDKEKDLSGMFSRGEFGGLLNVIFQPYSKTAFRWDGTSKLSGRRVNVFKFDVPQLPSGYAIQDETGTFIVPFKGSLYADTETKAVMRIHIACTDIPGQSSYREVDLTLDYKAMDVAGQEFTLPARFTINLRRIDAEVTIDATYKDYRRFAADATIIFDEEDPQ